MKKTKKAFTIIELLIVLIIILLIFSISSFNFFGMSDRQKLEIFTNKIISKVEEVRNNALVWKSVNLKWSWIFIPDAWKIEIKDSISKTSYCPKLNKDDNKSCDWDWKFYNKINLASLDKWKIEKKLCLDWGSFKEKSLIEIIFIWKEWYLFCGNGLSSVESYNLKIITKNNSKKFQIDFDSVNTLIESKKLAF